LVQRVTILVQPWCRFGATCESHVGLDLPSEVAILGSDWCNLAATFVWARLALWRGTLLKLTITGDIGDGWRQHFRVTRLSAIGTLDRRVRGREGDRLARQAVEGCVGVGAVRVPLTLGIAGNCSGRKRHRHLMARRRKCVLFRCPRIFQCLVWRGGWVRAYATLLLTGGAPIQTLSGHRHIGMTLACARVQGRGRRIKQAPSNVV
jgi:hypothetical protein